jgi:hypothetical protein
MPCRQADAGARTVAAALAKRPNGLIALDLSFNAIGAAGVAAQQDCLLPATYHLLPLTTYYLLPTTYYLLTSY